LFPGLDAEPQHKSAGLPIWTAISRAEGPSAMDGANQSYNSAMKGEIAHRRQLWLEYNPFAEPVF
jgi:hypothetical protein